MVSIKCFSARNKSKLFARVKFIVDLLFLELCKSCSASGIELETTTFRNFPCTCVFSGGQKLFSIFCILGFYRSQLQHIAAQASHPLEKVQHVQILCKHAGFYCEGWNCLALVPISRKALSAGAPPANTRMEIRLKIDHCSSSYKILIIPSRFTC